MANRDPNKKHFTIRVIKNKTMKANELRIGNLFIEKHSGKIIPVLELLRNGDIVFDFESRDKWQAEPIELTPEWLIKLGFKKLGDDEEHRFWLKYVRNDNAIFDFTSNYNKEDFNYVWEAKTKTEVIYLHEFQNLFFALTGQELSIKN